MAFKFNPFTKKLDITGDGGGGGGSVTIAGDEGSMSGSNLTIETDVAANNSGATLLFDNSGSTSTLQTSDANNNVWIGKGCGVRDVQSGPNVGIGVNVMSSLNDSTSGNNVAVGDSCLLSLSGGAGGNFALGTGSLSSLIDGTNNLAIGTFSGQGFSSSESNNICLGNQGNGGDNNTIRLGNSSHQRCFLSGAYLASGPTEVQLLGIGTFNSGAAQDQVVSIPSGSEDQVLTINSSNNPIFKDPVTNNTMVSFVGSGDAVSLTTATDTNIALIALSTGKWLVSALVLFAGSPTVSGPQQISISNTSATQGLLGDNSVQSTWQTANFLVGNCAASLSNYIVTVPSGPTNIYLVVRGEFSGGTMDAYGKISSVKIS